MKSSCANDTFNIALLNLSTLMMRRRSSLFVLLGFSVDVEEIFSFVRMSTCFGCISRMIELYLI